MAGCAFYIQDGGKGVCKSGTGRGLTVRQRGMRANPSPALLSPTGAQQGAPWRTVTAWRITNGLLGNVRYCRCANGLLPPPQPFLSLREQMLVALRASCSSPTGGGGRTASVRAVVPAVASARWGKPHPTFTYTVAGKVYVNLSLRGSCAAPTPGSLEKCDRIFRGEPPTLPHGGGGRTDDDVALVMTWRALPPPQASPAAGFALQGRGKSAGIVAMIAAL